MPSGTSYVYVSASFPAVTSGTTLTTRTTSILPDPVIILSVRSILFLTLLAATSAFGQQAPVTRAEFAEVFTQVAAGYLGQNGQAFPANYKRDGSPVSREEVCASILIVAVAGGKEMKIEGNAVQILRSARILSVDAPLFTQPGLHFRPVDLVGIL